jgi:hypothetical protein
MRAARSLACALALGSAMLAPAPAAAARYTAQDVGGWTVAASKDGQGCFLTKQYERAGGTTLLFGVDGDGTNHLSILNANWSIEPKDRLELTFRLGDNRYPKHFAVGLAADGKQGFVTSFGAKFPGQLAASGMLEITRGDVPVERLDLAGSGAAITELRNCIDALGAKAKAGDGEKAAADSIPKDPFAPAPQRKRRDKAKEDRPSDDVRPSKPARKAPDRLR